MTRYAVSLGSNLGDRVSNLRAGLAGLSRLGSMESVSGLFETEPVGGPEQDPYLNAAAVIEASLPPHELLARLQELEAAQGRVRQVRWGPRTLDLDIVASDGEPVDTPELEIPHPRAAERRFVLEPLVEIWPDATVAPGVTAASALSALAEGGVDRLADEWVEPEGRGAAWVAAQIVWLGAVGGALVLDGSLPDRRYALARITGGVLLACGLALALAAARSLGGSLTMLPDPKPGATMVEQGVYARARHPIYGGVILVVIGLSLLLASPVAVLLALGLGLFFVAKSNHEERRLRIAYPRYRQYRRRVRKRFIPFVV